MELTSVLNDEPASKDRLDRDKYAAAFARLAETCETPLVVGLYGTWGSGKTSLMRLIEKKIDKEKALSIWFDPWQHQFDESPLLALVHTLTAAASLGSQAEKLLTVVAAAFGSMILKATTSLNLKDIDELGERLERERFMVRDAQVRLRDHFRAIVEKARGKKRLVFFVDDLDRCVPLQIMKMLESLKLYLNLPECVYFLGVDRAALECSIKLQYKDVDLSERSYLDKIVQLPFTIPPIVYDSLGEFVQHLLPRELKGCRDLLATGLGENPREIKRFVNSLILNHNLAVSAAIQNYNPRILAALLLLQHRDTLLYEEIVANPEIFLSLAAGTLAPRENAPSSISSRLAAALSKLKISPNEDLLPYIYLTQLVRIPQGEGQPTKTIDLGGIAAAHLRWLESEGGEGKLADLAGYNLSYANFVGRNLTRARLRGATLKGANLKASLLRNADLRQAVLSGANLENTDLSSADLAGADLSGVNLLSAKLGNSNLRGANLSGAKLGDLTGVIAEGADLRQAILKSAKLEKADLSSADLTGADLSGADLRRTKLRSASLSGANLSGARLGDLAGANLISANLTEANAEGADLEQVVLKGANLEKADLSSANLVGGDLSGVDLYRTKLRSANLSGANLVGVILGPDNLAAIRSLKLKGAILQGLDLSHQDLARIDLEGANLRRTNLSGTCLCEANLSGADLGEANLLSADLTGAILSGANLSGAILGPDNLATVRSLKLRGANLQGLDLSHRDLTGIDLGGANLRRTNLSGTRLCEANLIGADLGEANLLSADLTGAIADRAIFGGCQLSNACFELATLRDAVFVEVRLNGCDLRSTDLRCANLKGASLAASYLNGADLAGALLEKCNVVTADMSGTVLLGCDLREVLGLSERQVQQAIIDDSTLLPAQLITE